MEGMERQLAIITNACCENIAHGKWSFCITMRLLSGVDKGKIIQKWYPYGDELPDYLRRDLLRLSCPASSPRELPGLKDKLRGVIARIALDGKGKIYINDYFGRGDPNRA